MATKTRGRRTIAGQLQALAGELGEVLDYRYTTDGEHESIGWHWTPSHSIDGCACDHCAAARDDKAAYLGYQMRQAMTKLIDYVRSHQQLVDEHQPNLVAFPAPTGLTRQLTQPARGRRARAS